MVPRNQPQRGRRSLKLQLHMCSLLRFFTMFNSYSVRLLRLVFLVLYR